MKLRSIILGLAIALLLAVSPLAPTQVHAQYSGCADRFTVYNQGSYSIISLYMRPVGGYWTDDLLGSYDTLAPGEYFHPLAGWTLASSVQEIRAYYYGGYYISDVVNVCAYNEVFYH